MSRTIYVVNYMGETDDLFYDVYSHRDEVARPYVYLREGIEQAGFHFKLTRDASDLSDAAALLNLCNPHPVILQNSMQIPREKRCFCLTEPPTVLPQLYDKRLADFFGTIFTLFDEMIDNRTYFKMLHTQAYEKKVETIPDFADKKFCCMIQTNHKPPDHPHELYSERQKIARDLEGDPGFDLFGRLWDGYGNWRGYVSNKSEVLKNYKFCFSYENIREMNDCISDRVFDSIYNGCVPVYWGAPNLERFVPKEAFIDRRDFASNGALIAFLKEMDSDRYQTYLDAADRYLQSEQAKIYTPRAFSEPILARLIPLARQP